MIRTAVIAISMLTVLDVFDAAACAVFMPMQARITKSTSEADTVVLGVVEQATDKSQSGEADHLWEGSVVLERILKGRTDTKRFRIGRSGSSATCDDGIPLPKPGDLWVLYLKDGALVRVTGGSFSSFPIKVARASDLWLDTILNATNGK